MRPLTRRQFLTAAAALGAAAAWAEGQPVRSRRPLRERRDLYPEGVASGDPDASSVILWTRRPYAAGTDAPLSLEVAEDEAFHRVVATARATVLAASDWTCRVLVGNLAPARVYWYRFIDRAGHTSRIGRTRTAPADADDRPVRFAFVSCQDANMGVLHAYRRLIAEDMAAPEEDRLGFVLHLGDFIYEVVWYPEDHPDAMLRGRPVRDLVRFSPGETIRDAALGIVHVPATLDDYRALYRAYLRDPDLQEARARWPFVCIWDNHEFSLFGWQSMQTFGGEHRPAQTRKVAALQAWFEFQPARVAKASGDALDRFDPPRVRDARIDRFDEHGFGDEPNNRAAVASLTAYRALRWGRHLDLLLTDQWSYRSEHPAGRREAGAFVSEAFPHMFPQEVLEILDGGRACGGGHPPETIAFGDAQVPNFRRHDPPQTLLGAAQKAWFMDRLQASRATWKVWGCSLGTLESRFDPQHLPDGFGTRWRGRGYATAATRDYSTAYAERAAIYAHVRDAGIAGFVTVSGDRHSFWAGLAAPALPPQPFEPVGIAFVTGSISAAGTIEYLEQGLPKDHPLRDLYILQRPDTPNAPTADRAAAPEPTMNLLMRHGVRSAIEYATSGDIGRARQLSNPELSPHLTFLDQGGHGYATVRVSRQACECEFVCIPRPIARDSSPEGPPVRYRVLHRAPLWKPGERPQLERRVVEGDPFLSL